jgi:hypothetical protein
MSHERSEWRVSKTVEVNQGDLACWKNKPAQVSTYKSHQSLVRAGIELQPPSADWPGEWLMRIILKGDGCTLSTQSAVTLFDGGICS